MTTRENSTPMTFLSSDQLGEVSPNALEWLWMPYVARGMITLLTSRWKSGKTTLLSVLLAKQAQGGELAGSPVLPARSVVVSEESPAIWSIRQRRLGLGSHVQWLCRPFRGRPSVEQWLNLIEQVASAKPDFVVFDTLGTLLPAMVENNASALTGVLDPIHQLTDQGAAVLLVHHPRKAGPNAELSPRGSGALTSFLDILCELDREPKAPLSDRRRRLRATSRLRDHSACTIVLNDDETDYTVFVESQPTEGFDYGWPILKLVFEGHYVPLTREKILARWPQEHPKPSPVTLWRWLDRAVEEKLVACRGRGNRSIPHRFMLVGRQMIHDAMMFSDDPNQWRDRLDEQAYSDAEDDLQNAEARIEKKAKADAARKAKREAKEASARTTQGTGSA